MASVALASLLSFALPSVALAGPIGDENANAGSAAWKANAFGNAQAEGSIDLYPAEWSIARGQTVHLKVRATQSYSVRVYRLGWYGKAGARQMLSFENRPADPQPYPSSSDPQTGFVEAKWHDSVTFATDSSWTPGLYVARAEHASGRQAMTFFVVRDDGFTTKMPILVSVTTGTHQAYNAWPGAERGGKSLYGFNSSGARPSESVSNQAVKVSYDRPYLVGGGTGDVLRYEYPFLRWAERNGWDVAWCTDEDLARDPSIARGRKVFAISGHWEYLSRPSYDAVLAARDSGTNLLVLSGDTLAWQVRLENGGKTAVSYKEGWSKDPEHLAGVTDALAGRTEEARAHFRVVTRGWKNLGSHAYWGIDERRPTLGFLGVQSAGAMGPEGPWGDLVIDAPDHWIFEGTGATKGSRIPRVMGYEYDSLYEGDPEFGSYAPAGRVKLGSNLHPRTGEHVGGAAYHRHASGAEVVALGAVNFAFALDGWASPWASEDARAQKMIDNALRRWTAGVAQPAPDPVVPVQPDAAVAVDASVAEDASAPDTSTGIDGAVVADSAESIDEGLVEAGMEDANGVEVVGDDAMTSDDASPGATPDAGAPAIGQAEEAIEAPTGANCGCRTRGASNEGSTLAILVGALWLARARLRRQN